MKAFFPETCPKYPRSVMRTGDGIPAGRVADGQEHEARRPHAVGGERGEHGGEQGETRGPWAGARRPRPPFPARVQEHGGDECVCSIESGPCERVESLQMSGRF